MATKKRSIIDDLRDSFTGLFSAPKTTTVSTPTTTKTTMPTNNWQLQKAIEKRNDPVAFEAKYPTVSSTPKIDYSNPLTFAKEYGKEWLDTAGRMAKSTVQPIVYGIDESSLSNKEQTDKQLLSSGKISPQEYSNRLNKNSQTRSELVNNLSSGLKDYKDLTSVFRNTSQGILQSIPKTVGSVTELAGNLGSWLAPKDSGVEDVFGNIASAGRDMSTKIDEIGTNVFQTKDDNQTIKNLGQSGGELLTDVATGKIALKSLGFLKYADDATKLQKLAKAGNLVQNLVSGKYASRVFNETYNNAKNAGQSDTQAGITATGNAAVQYIIERVSGVGKYLDKTVSGKLGKYVVNAIKEGGEEWLQQFVDNVANLTITPPKSIGDFTDRLFAGTGSAFTSGAFISFGATGASTATDTDAKLPTASEVPGGTTNLVNKVTTNLVNNQRANIAAKNPIVTQPSYNLNLDEAGNINDFASYRMKEYAQGANDIPTINKLVSTAYPSARKAGMFDEIVNQAPIDAQYTANKYYNELLARQQSPDTKVRQLTQDEIRQQNIDERNKNKEVGSIANPFYTGDKTKVTTKTIQDNHVKLAQSLDTVAPGSPEQRAIIEQMKANQQAKAEVEQAQVTNTPALTPKKITEEQYLRQNGGGLLSGHDPAMDNMTGASYGGRKHNMKMLQENSRKAVELNVKLREEYRQKVANGEIIEPNGIDRALNQASGNPEARQTQAAKRFLENQGIDWKTGNKINTAVPALTPEVGKVEVPKTVKIFTKSKFNPDSKGSYADYPVIRQEDNITLYQGTNPGENRQFWTPNKKYAEKFGSVREKTGSFYQVDNGNRMTDVYVEVPTKSSPQVTKTEVPANQDIVNIDSNENAIRETASEYRTAKEYQDELTDLVWSNNKKGQGVEFINNENKYEPGFDIKRISNNTPFYRQFFAENGRKPTKGEIATLIDDYLNGKDNIMKYELAPEEVDVFNIIKENESAPLDVIEKSAPLSQPVDNIPEIAKQVTTKSQPKVTKTVSEKAAKTSPQTRGFVESVQQASNVDAAVKKGVEGLYAPKTNKTLMGEAIALLNEGTTIDFKNIKNLDQKVAATMQEAINQQAAGNHQAAADLFNNLSEHGTEIARGLQAFSLLENMSPEAISLSVAGRIKKYNATHPNNKIPELTGEQQKVISDKIIAADLLTGRDKNIAMNELDNTISEFIPSSIVDKALAVWKAGLLTSFRTHERNFVGNTIHGIAEMAKDVPAAGADVLMSKKTGQRTLTATTKGTRDFASKSTRQQIADIVSKGYDPSESLNKFDYKKITWGDNKIEQGLKKYTDIVFNTLGAADKPFYNAAMARSLYDQAGAAAINAGKRGDKVFIENLVKNPTEDMVKIATGDANVATFKDKNAATNVVNQLKQGLGKTEAGKLIGEVTMPFTGVPTSILGQIQAYSPIGLVKGIAKTGKVVSGKVPELQRRAAQELGRGVIGTGIYGLGAYLAGLGLITGQPKDTEESKQWELENKPRNSIMIGGKWRSLNSIGPEAVVFLAGAKLSEELGREDGSIANYATTLGKDYLDQSFVTGLQGPINAITDPARYGKYYAGNTISSVIPNIVKDASKAFDSSARESNTVSDYAKQGIPFLRQTLTEKRDVLGNVIKQQPTGIGAFVDLFNSKTPVNNDVVNELGRLYKAGESATPSKMSAKYTVDGEKVELTPAELNNLEIKSGTAINAELDKLVKSSEYQSADDETKKNTIDALIRDIRSEAKLSTASGTVMSTSDIATKARNKLTLDQFDKSGENYLEKDGYVYTRDEDGNAKVTTKIKYDYNLNKATLTKLKSDGNLDGWLKQADLQARNIYEQMNNENISPIEKLSLENELNSLIGNISKYTSYGGFTKGSSKSDTTTKAEIAKILSILNSTRDTSNDTYKTLNSLLQGTRSYTKPSVQKVALKKITVKK